MQDKQRKFALEYIKDFNATQAAIRTGYSKNGASVQGSRLLADPKIAALITELKDKAESKAIKSYEDLCHFYSQAVDAWEEKMADRIKAADSLAKIRGYNAPDKQEVAVDHSVQVEFVN